MQLKLFECLPNKIKEGSNKKCTKCNEIKPLDAFGTVNGGLIRPECRKCMNEMVVIRNKLRKENLPAPQDYVCPICRQKAEQVKDYGGKRNQPWVIDHCHISNEFRGWLCHRCNRGLGSFGDNVNFLQRAIKYLERNLDEH